MINKSTHHPWSRLYCWHSGHHWVDDGFMGDTHECARCGAFDGPIHVGKAEAFILGMAVGTIMVAGMVLIVLGLGVIL